jgi:hypothetical protein
MRPAYPIWALAVASQLIGCGYLLASPNATSCGELAEKYRLDPELTEAAMALWAQGIMHSAIEDKGVRQEAKRDLTIDSKEQADRLRAYCDAHPFASFNQALRTIYPSLQP